MSMNLMREAAIWGCYKSYSGPGHRNAFSRPALKVLSAADRRNAHWCTAGIL